MNEVKKEEKPLTDMNNENDPKPTNEVWLLDGKKLHDLYRHSTKLIE
jgi:hypothetical protein